MKKHYSYNELKGLLSSERTHANTDAQVIQEHLDNCRGCWDKWSRVRWDSAIDSRGVAELKEFLGNEFEPYYDSSWALADEWGEKNPQTAGAIIDFYKKTKHYITNLVIWSESGDRDKFDVDIEQFRDQFGVRSVLDFGCGVGTDTFVFNKLGLETLPLDLIGYTSDFFKWRVNHRGIECTFYDAEKTSPLPSADMFWAIDVLEHLPNPSSVIESLDDKTYVFVHRSEFNDKAGGRHPCHINYDEQKLSDKLKSKGFQHIPWERLSVWLKPNRK